MSSDNAERKSIHSRPRWGNGVFVFLLALASLGSYSFSALAASGATTRAVSPCRAPHASSFVRTELFFGKSIPGGGAVTEGQFAAFVDDKVTPRFPNGLTVLPAMGQFLESNGTLDHEGSDVIVLLYPRSAADASGQKIEQIRTAYINSFHQESVLRIDERPTCVSF